MLLGGGRERHAITVRKIYTPDKKRKKSRDLGNLSPPGVQSVKRCGGDILHRDDKAHSVRAMVR